MDYRKCAQEIYDTVGKRENLVSVAHCATRLRLVTNDNSGVDTKKLEDIEGVKGVFSSNGQLQIIIGTGTVNKVYDEFLDISGMTAATKDDVKAAAAAQMPLWKKILKTPGDVFVPILPAIVASGLMMGIVEAIPKFIPAFGDTDWFSFLDLVANTAFAMLPILVAVSAARVFGGNIFLGTVIGMLMVHPSLINAWTVSNYGPGTELGEIPVWHLLFFTVKKVGFQGHVIPVILAVLLMATVERWLHKHVPEMIDLFVTPLCTVLVTALATFTIIGPIFNAFESAVLAGAQALVSMGFGIGAAIMGAIYPITVVMGLHHMYNVIEAGLLSTTGVNFWMPIASAANFAQFGACLAVALKVHNEKTKSVAVPSSLSASLGITEPAIFGINFRFMKPFVCGMIGGACGSLFAAGPWAHGTNVSGETVKFGATVYGVTGIPGIPAVNNIPFYLIELCIAAGVAFALTWVVWKEEEPAAASGGSAPAAPAAPAIDTEPGVIYSPVEGTAIPRDQIPDPTFASGVLGDGVGINPDNGIVVAPCDGEISSVAESKHAIGISSPDGMEMLIHVGVDTVAMNGTGFEPQVKEGDQVKAGQVLLKFSREEIKKAGHPDTVVTLLTNSEDYDGFKVVKTGPVKQLDKIFTTK